MSRDVAASALGTRQGDACKHVYVRSMHKASWNVPREPAHLERQRRPRRRAE
jgi:hypothetical protein